MTQEFIEVKRDRFHLIDQNQYILQGNFPEESEVRVFLDAKEVNAVLEPWLPGNAWERFEEQKLIGGRRVTVTITLPDNLEAYHKLKVYAVKDGKQKAWYEVKVSELAAKQGKPYFYIEEMMPPEGDNIVKIRGWVVARQNVVIAVRDLDNNDMVCTVNRIARTDVQALYDETEVDEKCGFYIEVPNPMVHAFRLIFDGGDSVSEYLVNLSKIARAREKASVLINKGTRYFRTWGAKKTLEKVVRKALHVEDKPIPYEEWLPKHLATAKDLDQQRKTAFDIVPKISIVVPLYKTPEKYLRSLVKSIQAQSYSNWELCLSDGSGADSPLKALLAELKKDERIKTVSHDTQLRISENTNAAIEIATGDFIAFADHDDELTPDALFECVKAINEDPSIEILYTDEDKMTMDGHKYFQPHMKPDFNIDLLCTVNYICHLFVVKRDLLDLTNLLRPEYDGAQDYDFILRCVETSSHIHHIPRVLYHWRCHEDSTAENPESKLYAFDAGQRAIQAHYCRIGVPAEVNKGEYLGLYRTKYLWNEKPLVSILIPNKDHIDDLDRCIQSIEQKSTYKNYEYIIIENNSTEEETFAYYKQLEASNEKVKVVYYKGNFNFSAINNFGAKYASGEYYLLLNNDTEIINAECIEEMLGYCMREDVGAVGARLYYEDDTIQHAGVIIGFGAIAGHAFVQHKRSETGYCHRIICAQDYSAVTAACMMVKKKAYDEVGGLCEELEVAFNDIDFCLLLRKAGYLIVYNPYAILYHYESKSRGMEDTPEKRARFNKEVSFFNDRWKEILDKGDPYYNPNLTLDSQDFSLRRI